MTRYPQTILATCVIPWDEQERLLEDTFRREIRHLAALDIKHLYVFGTAGEGYAVDDAQFRDICSIFYEETARAGITAQVGIIALSLRQITARIQIAYDLGFRIFQISFPPWKSLHDDEVLAFFRGTCGAFPDCQFLHYNTPVTKRALTGVEYAPLVEAFPNLVATKNTVADFSEVVSLMRHAPQLQHFFGERTFPHGCMIGECSLLPSVSLGVPRRMHALFAAGLARDAERLFHMQIEHEVYVRDVLGALLAQRRIDGAYDKLLVRLAGFEEMPLNLLAPYQGFTEADYQTCKRVLLEKYADWTAFSDT